MLIIITGIYNDTVVGGFGTVYHPYAILIVNWVNWNDFQKIC